MEQSSANSSTIVTRFAGRRNHKPSSASRPKYRRGKEFVMLRRVFVIGKGLR